MKLKKIIFIVFILIMTISVYGCSPKESFKKLFSKNKEEVDIIRSDEEQFEVEEDDGLRDTVLYFQNKEGLIVPVMREIPWEEGIGKLAIRNMVDSPSLREDLEPTSLVPIIPAGTNVNGMSIDEAGNCKIDFTKEILNYNTEKEENNLINGIVYTLTEFPTINQVQIMIDGEVVESLKYGTEINQPLKRNDINLVQDLQDSTSKVIVYFKGTDNGEFEYYVPVTVPTFAPMANVFTALEELFNGPPSEIGLYSGIPEGVCLQGVEVKDGIAYVDLTADSLESIKEQYIFDNVLKSVGLTLNQFDEVNEVELLIDGKTLEQAGVELTLPECIPTFANEY